MPPPDPTRRPTVSLVAALAAALTITTACTSSRTGTGTPDPPTPSATTSEPTSTTPTTTPPTRPPTSTTIPALPPLGQLEHAAVQAIPGAILGTNVIDHPPGDAVKNPGEGATDPAAASNAIGFYFTTAKRADLVTIACTEGTHLGSITALLNFCLTVPYTGAQPATVRAWYLRQARYLLAHPDADWPATTIGGQTWHIQYSAHLFFLYLGPTNGRLG